MWENITSSTKGAATWEIIIMLLGAFLLGYLLRYVMGKKRSDFGLQVEIDRLRSENSKLKAALDACNKIKASAGLAAAAVAAAALTKK